MYFMLDYDRVRSSADGDVLLQCNRGTISFHYASTTCYHQFSQSFHQPIKSKSSEVKTAESYLQ